jgi:tetratricopeptide (TPR) repeat protein
MKPRTAAHQVCNCANENSPRKDSRRVAAKKLPWLLLIAILTFSGPLSYSQTASNNEKATSENGEEGSSAASGALARARSDALDRHYKEAIRILRSALQEHPGDNALQLELGRVYLATGADGKARRLFREVLQKNPEDRAAQLELARTLGYQRQYGASDDLYRRILAENPADETAAIGLTNNLMHEGQSAEAGATADMALTHHPNSLRLLEYKDRIARGLVGGDERGLPAPGNAISTDADYVSDSAGNRSWRVAERLEYKIRPGLISDLHLEQHHLRGLKESSETEDMSETVEAVETFSETLRWRPLDRLALTVGGGAVHFDKGEVHAIYEVSLAGKVASHFLVGAGFARNPIVPDAKAASLRLTAQGWEAFSIWAPAHWQVNVRASRRHYSDENVGAQQSAEVVHQWTTSKANFTAGYRFRHFGFAVPNVAHGYFSPDNYQSHQAVLGASFRPARWDRFEVTGRAGAESIATGADFQRAWDITARNQLLFRNWEVNLSYSRFDISQFTGAFKADAARFELAYHF